MSGFYDLHSALKEPLAVETLHLDRSQLKAVPEQILAFKNLRLLNLSHNELTVLPDWLDQFPHLKTLQVAKNQLRELPECLRFCSALEFLDLRSNIIENLDSTFLPAQLIQLDLSDNQLQKFQSSAAFPKLKVFKINQNKLTTFPKITNAPKLDTLEIYKNKIKKWPKNSQMLLTLEKLNLGCNLLKDVPEYLEDLERLKYLDLSNNKISGLPTQMGHCTALRNLNLANNQLDKLPETFAKLSWLVDLEMSRNNFASQPKVLAQLPRLDRLNLSRNQLGPDFSAQLPISLRVLDLSNNPIETAKNFPIPLKQLYLNNTSIRDLDFLQRLGALEHLDLSRTKLGELPKSLFLLTGLRQKGLTYSLTGLQKKMTTQLLSNTRKDFGDLPENTTSVQILGRLTINKSAFEASLKETNLEITPDSKWCILGKGPYPELKQHQIYHFFNEAQLLTFLKIKKQNGLSLAQKEKLERLLLHPNSRQVKMALLLLKGKTIDPWLLPALIASWKLQQDPKVKRQLSTLVQQNQHPDYEALRNVPLQSKETGAILHWIAKAGLNPDDFQHWKIFFQKK